MNNLLLLLQLVLFVIAGFCFKAYMDSCLSPYTDMAQEEIRNKIHLLEERLVTVEGVTGIEYNPPVCPQLEDLEESDYEDSILQVVKNQLSSVLFPPTTTDSTQLLSHQFVNSVIIEEEEEEPKETKPEVVETETKPEVAEPEVAEPEVAEPVETKSEEDPKSEVVESETKSEEEPKKRGRKTRV